MDAIAHLEAEYEDYRAAQKVRGFMCKVDFECELDGAEGGTKVYPDLEDLKAHRVCVKQCGIVEVEVTLVRVVEPANYPRSNADSAATGDRP